MKKKSAIRLRRGRSDGGAPFFGQCSDRAPLFGQLPSAGMDAVIESTCEIAKFGDGEQETVGSMRDGAVFGGVSLVLSPIHRRVVQATGRERGGKFAVRGFCDGVSFPIGAVGA